MLVLYALMLLDGCPQLSVLQVFLGQRRRLTFDAPACHHAAASATTAQLLRALLWLLAGSDAGGGGEGGGDPGAKEEVLEVVSQLAAVQTPGGNGHGGGGSGGNAQDLFTKHFTELLAYVVGNGDGRAPTVGAGDGEGGGGWDKGSRRRAGFEALLRSAPAAVGSHLDEVMPIFRGLLHDASRCADGGGGDDLVGCRGEGVSFRVDVCLWRFVHTCKNGWFQVLQCITSERGQGTVQLSAHHLPSVPTTMLTPATQHATTPTTRIHHPKKKQAHISTPDFAFVLRHTHGFDLARNVFCPPVLIREPELRLSMLALLECVVKQDGVTEESLRPHAETLLKEIVLPNAVWRAGLVAATVRKVGTVR